jgi:quercetin dioxygenase-like cupin family protein
MTSSHQLRAEDSPFVGVNRTTFDGQETTVVEYRFAHGAFFPLHHHPQEQVTIVLSGRIYYSDDDGERTFEAGQWVSTPSGVIHGIRADDEGATFLAVLAPPRARDESPTLITHNEPGATA